MIAVTARVEVEPADADAFVAASAKLIEPTRAERGCTLYAMARDIVADNVVWISEEWDCDADLDAHLRSAHIKAFYVDIAPLRIRVLETRKYEVSSVGPVVMPAD